MLADQDKHVTLDPWGGVRPNILDRGMEPIECASCLRELAVERCARLHKDRKSLHLDQRNEQLDERCDTSDCAGRGDVVRLAVLIVVRQLLGAARYRARIAGFEDIDHVPQEPYFLRRSLEQRNRQPWEHDREYQAGQPSACSDVNQSPPAWQLLSHYRDDGECVEKVRHLHVDWIRDGGQIHLLVPRNELLGKDRKAAKLGALKLDAERTGALSKQRKGGRLFQRRTIPIISPRPCERSGRTIHML